jgi:hypothetical protein
MNEGGIYLHDWAEGGFEAMCKDFEISPDQLNGVYIILASYSYGNWSGDAFVLFEQDGKLYEVNGTHCSCYGLEGQWNPEETNVDVLLHRLENRTLGKDDWCGNEFADELRIVLNRLREVDAS